MMKWNPFNSTRQTGDQDIGSNDTNNGSSAMSSSQNHEQDSAYIGQTSSNAEPQREPTNILPSDFGGYLLHPENKTNQSSDLMHGSDDMVARKDRTIEDSKKAASPGHAFKPELTHDEDIGFFGDSNTTELHATSRSTLDQAGLHRGSITTLPSAGDRRRGSAQSSGRRESLNNERRGSAHQRGVPISGLGGVHAPESATSAAANVNVPIGGNALSVDNKVSALPSDKLSSVDESKQENDATARKNSLTGMASAAVTGVAAAATGAAAAILGTGHQQTNTKDEATSKMPSAWPDAQDSGYILQRDSIKKDATNCTDEPSIHGQTPCFYTKDNICDEKHEDLNTHCEHVREPSIHGQNPSFFCDKKQTSGSSDARDAIKCPAITGNDLTQSYCVNTHPINAQGTDGSNFSGLHDSKGIDSDAITAGSDPTGSHRHVGTAAAATAIGTGAGIAAFNRKPIDAEAIRHHSLDHSKDGIQDKDMTGAGSNEKMGDGYILDRDQARKLSTDSGLHGIHDSTSATTYSHAIPASELCQPCKRTDLGESTLYEGQVPMSIIAASSAAGATAASTASTNNPTDKQTDYSVDKAQPSNMTDVYRNNARDIDNDMVVPDNPEPTTANVISNASNVHRGNAEGETANMVTPGNSTVGNTRSNTEDTTSENITAQDQQTPRVCVDDSSSNKAAKAAAAAGGITAAVGGLLGFHHKGSAQSKTSADSNDSSSLSRNNRTATPESNNINAVYQTNAQDVHSNQITKENPTFDVDRNNVDDVYRSNAQGVYSDQVSDRNATPTTALYENDVRDVYRTNAEGTTQNLIAPGNPTTSYKVNDISDVYRTTPRSTTPSNSTPNYSETPKQGSSHKHDSLLASGGIAAAVGGIMGVQHHNQDKRSSSNNDTALHTDKLPLDHTVDQKPLSDTPVDNNAHPQQIHSNRATGADSSLHHDKLPLDQTIDQQPVGNTLMDNNTHPQQMHSAASQVPENRANDSLHPQTGSQSPAPFIAGNTANSNGPGNLEQTQETPVTDNHRQIGTMGSAPVDSGPSDPAQAHSMNPQGLGTSGTAPIIASSTGVPVPGNINRSKGSFSSTRAITDNIVPSPAAGGALSSRPDEVKDRSLDRENQIKQPDPKRRGSLTDGIKSVFRRMSLKSDKKANKDGRRLSAAEAFKKQTLTNNGKSKSAPITATTANVANSDPTNNTAVSGSDAAPIAPAQQNQQNPTTEGFIINSNEASAASGSTNQDYARIPGVYSLKPAGTVNVADNGEVNFVKLNEEAHASAPTKSTSSDGKNEHRRGSIQNTIGKIIGTKNMQDKGTHSQVSGKEKTDAYNAHTHPTNLNNF
ncbi:uncharacterized protein ATC70_010833 [Mucor velutinosus]|uniref:Uncharacterized protein n=1 Tax=Mucor velutinosus TaxID=708070 RepID=A0AAN7DH76_9FUNG|nr:hypothetical protein ATC70_010833 [Mucor velutinosus]